jgi:glycerophosphoryl diester phosphodiesterase
MKKVKIVGHRGASGYAPENTILSFQKAIDIGCDRTELDVRLSKDNEIIVIHDAEVNRISDGYGLISEMNLAEIKKINYPENQKIPTLQEVINLCKDKIDLCIELKAKGTSKAVNDIILKNQLLSSVIVVSFDIDLVREIKKLSPDIKVGFLFGEYNEEIWNFADSVPLEYICPECSMIDKEMVEKAHSLDLKIYTWTVNKKKTYDYLMNLGVDEIATDFPKLFI